MRNLLQKKLNKKGFTLAELLIVVAIIAILVAVAMPMFFGALDNAKEQTWNANARALKAIGVATILSNPSEYDPSSTDYYVTGTPDGKGDFGPVTIATSDPGTGKTAYDSGDPECNSKPITVVVKATEVTGP